MNGGYIVKQNYCTYMCASNNVGIQNEWAIL